MKGPSRFSSQRFQSWFLLFGVFAGAAAGVAKEVEEAELAALDGNEGYLVVGIDTDTELFSVRLSKDGGIGGHTFKKLSVGRTVKILRLDAGEYRYSKLESMVTLRMGAFGGSVHDDNARRLPRHRYKLDEVDTIGPVQVEAGVVRYAGDLVLRFRAGMVAASLSNRLELARSELAKGNASLGIAAGEMVWSGPGYDPWAQRSPRTGSTGLVATECADAAPASADRPSAETLYMPEEIRDLGLSPGGNRVVEAAYRNGRYELNVLDPEAKHRLNVYEGVARVDSAYWDGPLRIVADLSGSSGTLGTRFFTFQDGPLAGQAPVHGRVDGQGRVLDPMPQHPNHILFQMYRIEQDDPLQVFRLDLSKGNVPAAQMNARVRLDGKVENDVAWVNDPEGNLVAALVDDGQARRIVARASADAAFGTVLTLREDALADLLSRESSGHLLVLSNQGRNQTELLRIDPAVPESAETVFSLPGVDLQGVLIDRSTGDLLGVRHSADGVPRVELLGDASRWNPVFDEIFPDRDVTPVEIDSRTGKAVVAIGSDIHPDVYFLVDLRHKRFWEIGKAAPWLDGMKFVGRTVIEVPGKDGRTLQALLAVPDGEGTYPLIVMPHGGPIFVQDQLHFDRDVQFWSTRGYAVLQVNFRGSYGFGVQHLLEGFGGFGRQIEDDIESAVAHVLDSQPRIDERRVCAVGSSYGGYSAMMLAIREPARFRCAVAVSAPSDLPLLFTSSDWSDDPRAHAVMSRVVGNPEDPALVEMSPAYQAANLKSPVLLVHGTEDRRVDYEHSARLARVLDAADGHRLVRIDGMGHSPNTVAANACIMNSAEAFVREHLLRQ